MVPFNFRVLAKFGLCSQKFSECSQKFCNCSHARILVEILWRVAEAQFAIWKQKLMLQTMFPVWQNLETLEKPARATKTMNVCGVNAFSLCSRFIETAHPDPLSLTLLVG